MRGELPPPAIGVTFNTRFDDIDAEKGSITAHFTIGKEYTNPMGNVQGGIVAAMLDDTMGPALSSMLEENQFAPTLNLNISFITGAKPGEFTGKGKVIKRGRSVAYLESELFDADNKLVATATATAKITQVDF